MGAKRTYKQNRAKAGRSWRERYNVYVRWYKHYADRNEMSEECMLDLGAYKATVLRKKYRGEEMTNISRRVAWEQRQASETQLRVTWKTVKDQLPEFKKTIKLTRERIQREKLAEYVTGKKNLSFDQIDRALEKWGDKPIPESVLKKAEAEVRGEMSEEINFLNTYGDVKFNEFRKKQKEIVNSARRIVTEKYDRETWNQAFAEAVSYVYRQ